MSKEAESFSLVLHKVACVPRTTVQLAEELKLDIKQVGVLTDRNGKKVRQRLSGTEQRLSEYDEVLEAYLTSCPSKPTEGTVSERTL